MSEFLRHLHSKANRNGTAEMSHSRTKASGQATAAESRRPGNKLVFTMISCAALATICLLYAVRLVEPYSYSNVRPLAFVTLPYLWPSVTSLPEPADQPNNSAAGGSFESGQSGARFGFVMSDLARRVLSRNITLSNVLVVATDASAGIESFLNNHTRESVSKDTTNGGAGELSLGAAFVQHAATEGHTIHTIDVPPNEAIDFSLDDWITSFDLELETKQSKRWHSYLLKSPVQMRPNWILLSVFDLPFGKQDALWADTCRRFMAQTTLTYLVVSVHSSYDNPHDENNPNITMDGLAAARALIRQRYKLQVLSASHFYAEDSDLGLVHDRFGPNSLLKSEDDVQSFLRWGASAAKRYSGSSQFTGYLFATQGLDLAIPSARTYLDDDSRVQGAESQTQVDLYRQKSKIKSCSQKRRFRRQMEIRFDSLLNEDAIRVDIPIPNEDGQGDDQNRIQTRVYHPKAPQVPGFSYVRQEGGDDVTSRQGPGPDDVTLWFDGSTIQESEAACVQTGGQSRCLTRILAEGPESSATSHHDKRPNLLLILVDPMSREYMKRTMPKTLQVLNQLDFLHFENYSAVGPNSGPNQAALYSGMPLANREGINKDGVHTWLWDRLRAAGYKTLKAEDGCIENSNMVQSLQPNTTHGTALHRLFCFDFDRPSCVGPDLASSILLQYDENFVQTYHSQKMPFASFLHFVDTHEDTLVLADILDGQISKHLEWLKDQGVLDNTVVIVTSDHGLHYGPYYQSKMGRLEATEPFLHLRIPPNLYETFNIDVVKQNSYRWTTAFDLHETMLELTSTHDIEKMQFSRPGKSLLRELPLSRETCKGTNEIPREYCEMREVSLLNDEKCTRTPRVPSILSFYADIPRGHRPIFQDACFESIGQLPTSRPSRHQRCQCATSHRDWYECNEHPWGGQGVHSSDFSNETFAIAKCEGQELSIDTRVMRQEALVKRSIGKREGANKKAVYVGDVERDPSWRQTLRGPGQDTLKRPKQPPNILFVEVDSAALAYADRHLPLTRKFLKEHQMVKNSESGFIGCSGEVCAADFSMFALTGPNSISNQVSALSGCAVSRFHDSCFQGAPLRTEGCVEENMFRSLDSGSCESCPKNKFPIDPLNGCTGSASMCCTDRFPVQNEKRVCRDNSLLINDLQLFRRGPRRHTNWCQVKEGVENDGESLTPWLFDVAKESGYVTYFGEELCYDESLYVTQNNVFPLGSDYEVHKLYCRLNNNENYGRGEVYGSRLCAIQSSADGKSINPSLDHLMGIWKAYHDVPKFAFVNSIAAHDYDKNWARMISASEEYDVQLSDFLRTMTQADDFSNTVIILRSDHGLQGGFSTVEYSTQVEHREPWTQILMPQKLVPSLEALYENQQRLATGFDLYRTLRELMRPGDTHTPDWSYNLLQSIIPDTRSCWEAKVPADFCPCESEAPPRPPNFGVCNTFDAFGDLYCANSTDSPIIPALLEPL